MRSMLNAGHMVLLCKIQRGEHLTPDDEERAEFLRDNGLIDDGCRLTGLGRAYMKVDPSPTSYVNRRT